MITYESVLFVNLCDQKINSGAGDNENKLGEEDFTTILVERRSAICAVVRQKLCFVATVSCFGRNVHVLQTVCLTTPSERGDIKLASVEIRFFLTCPWNTLPITVLNSYLLAPRKLTWFP